MFTFMGPTNQPLSLSLVLIKVLLVLFLGIQLQLQIKKLQHTFTASRNEIRVFVSDKALFVKRHQLSVSTVLCSFVMLRERDVN